MVLTPQNGLNAHWDPSFGPRTAPLALFGAVLVLGPRGGDWTVGSNSPNHKPGNPVWDMTLVEFVVSNGYLKRVQK